MKLFVPGDGAGLVPSCRTSFFLLFNAWREQCWCISDLWHCGSGYSYFWPGCYILMLWLIFPPPLDLWVSVWSVRSREKHLKNEVCLSLLWVSNTELCVETKLNLSCNCQILLGTSMIPPQAFWFFFFTMLNSRMISVCCWGLILCNCCFPKEINSRVTQSVFQGSIEFPSAVPWNIKSEGFACLIKAF